MNYVTPVGFRDVLGTEALVREELASRVREVLAKQGYQPIETPTLEVLDVMKAGGHVPNSPFKFFDSYGDLLAMRPDVTMQVARMCATRVSDFSEPLKLRYNQRIFREDAAEADRREVTQLGIENLGASGIAADAEIVHLFSQCLDACNLSEYTIALGSARVLRDLLEHSEAPVAWQIAVLQAYHTSNFVDLAELVASGEANAKVAEAIRVLPKLRGDKNALAKVRAVVEPLGCSEGIDELEAIYDSLVAAGFEGKLLIDFSVISSLDYYTGIVFEAYAPGLGSPLGSGGRYDTLLERYGAQPTPAAGFAFFLEQVMEAYSAAKEGEDRPLRIAVPKGSLNEGAIKVLADAGLDVDGLANAGRTLMLRNGDVEYLIVRPTDAPVFVSTGAADCGI
jgi:ATP phosphoribosyltransferase regulatory subunit